MRIFTTSFFGALLAWVVLSAASVNSHLRRLPSFAFNTEVANMFGADARFLPGNFINDFKATPSDSAATAFQVLLFNYSVYDSTYATQMHNFLARELPGASLSEFKNESLDRLERLLEKQQAVVITYPSNGDAEFLASVGKKLEAFVRNGGVVVLTGSHETSAIHALGLLTPEEAYYYEDVQVQQKRADHPMLKGVPTNFTLSNFIYPMEFTDADFTTVAESEGMSVLGYKELGEGKVIYLGLEYYTDEAIPSRILGNIFKWALTPNANTTPTKTEFITRTVRRTEEILYAGSVPRFDLKIYPNPYMEKASLEIDLDKQTQVSAEMTDETGKIVAVLLPQRTLSSGFYRMEIPNVAAGIYLVQCKIGNHLEVRKVVKITAN